MNIRTVMMSLSFTVSLIKAAVILVPAEYSTISDAINAAAENDTIRISDGLYKEK